MIERPCCIVEQAAIEVTVPLSGSWTKLKEGMHGSKAQINVLHLLDEIGPEMG